MDDAHRLRFERGPKSSEGEGQMQTLRHKIGAWQLSQEDSQKRQNQTIGEKK